MEEEGLSKEKILDELERKLAIDLTYESGRILGSMCTNPDKFALEVFSRYACKNLGDPGLFPGTQEVERDLINEIGKLLGGKNITGSIVSGGSESNLIAISIAKMLKPKIKKPEIVCSENIHMSFYKATGLMNIKLRVAKLNENFLPNMDEYASLINKNTIACIGIAGTTALGLVEPIDEIAKLADKNNIFLHIDAAFGGFVLPFMEDLGFKFPLYDFRVPKVDTIAADPHKMGMGLIPGGGLLIRESSVIEKYGYSIPYLAGGNFKHLTITGTRSGASAIAFWALMKHLGRNGFKENVKRCWDNTQYFVKRVKEIEGIELACNPVINVVGIKASSNISKSICRIDEELRKKGWALGVFRNFNLARIVCMPHIHKEHLDDLLVDLEKAVKDIRNQG